MVTKHHRHFPNDHRQGARVGMLTSVKTLSVRRIGKAGGKPPYLRLALRSCPALMRSFWDVHLTVVPACHHLATIFQGGQLLPSRSFL